MARCVAVLISFPILACAAGAQPTVSARALLFGDPGTPLAQVPGQPGRQFSSSGATSSLALSPDGTRWAALWNSSDGVTSFNNIVTGDQDGIDYVFTQGDLFPGLGYTIDRRPDESISVNNAGQVSATVTVLGAGAVDRQRVVRYNHATGLWDEIIRGDGVITGLGQSIPGAEGERYPSAAFTSGTIIENGRIAISARGTRSILPADQDELLLLSGNPIGLIAQGGVLVPSGQLNGAADVLTDIDDEVYLSENGDDYLLTGDLARGVGLTEVVVVNDQAVYEVGMSLPGLVGTTFSLPTARLFPGGNWGYNGVSTAGESYLVVNGQVYIKENDPVPGGEPGELFDSTRGFALNAAGDLAIAMLSKGIDPPRFLIVLDPIDGPADIAVDDRLQFDIDADNIADQAFYNDLNSPFMWLGPDRELVFTARLKDRFQLNIADGIYIVMTEPPACPADVNGDGAATPADFSAWITAFNTSAPGCDQNNDTFCTPADFSAWIANFNAGCP